ncbi:hypothetical protein RDWZM_004116 [Blomia tropicalis]|uniref:Uncharacterized protein n=1 Tax=Blomia tropicalis TaxID=40697 RepID=A0A9Q0MGM0_BLOTA|nr:hypothetical protein RDWZM_004116 [Blomia tropicalis]
MENNDIDSIVPILLEYMNVPIVLIMGTFLLIVFFTVIRIGCWSELNSNIITFYDDANAFNYHYQYIVRLLYGPKSTTFDESTTTIYVEIEHSIKRIVKIPFTPSTMNEYSLYKGYRSAKLFIRTRERYSNIRNSLLYHNGRGSIVIVAVELQDVNEENSIASSIQSPIYGMTEKANTLTSYPFGMEQPTELENDIRPTRNVTIGETIYFLYSTINCLFLLVMLLMKHYCTGLNQADNRKYCLLDKTIELGSYAGMGAFAFFVITLIPFRLLVKLYFYHQLGRGCSQFFRTTYLTLIVGVGISCGITCGQYSFNDFYEKEVNRYHPKWLPWIVFSIATGFGLFILLISIGVTIPLAVYLQFIVLPENDQSFWNNLPIRGRTETQTTTSNDRTVLRKYKSKKALLEAKSYIEEVGDYQQKRVEEIKLQNKNLNRMKKRRKSETPNRMKQSLSSSSKMTSKSGHKSDQSSYGDLNKQNRNSLSNSLYNCQHKVRSISNFQFEDDEDDQEPNCSTPKGSQSDNTGSTKNKSKPRNNNKFDDNNNDNSKESKRQQQQKVKSEYDNASTLQNGGKSSENYFQTMCRITRVKSVSQYIDKV